MGFSMENLDLLARLLLQALLNTLWQGLFIAALVWLLLRALRRASATTRHAIWLVSLLTIGALPFIALVTQRERSVPVSASAAPLSPSAPRAEPSALPTIAPELSRFLRAERMARLDVPSRQAPLQTDPGYNFSPTVDNSIALPATGASLTPAIEKQSFGKGLVNGIFRGIVPELLVGMWLLGCVLMLWRVGRSYYSLFRLRRQLGFVPAKQRARAQALAEIFGIRRRVRLFTSHRISMPMTIGSLRPLIILPPEFAANLAPAEFESVIAHELAHIKRWDYLTNLLQRLVQAFLFFHPAVLFINRQLLLERELACDDWAVKMCEPRRYASCLTRLVELLGESSSQVRVRLAAAGMIFGKHVISRRVEMILNRERNATTAVSKPALIYAISLAVLFIAVCSLIAPVIAVPLGQQPAAKQPPRKETKATTPAPVRAPEQPPLPAPAAPIENVVTLPDDPDFPEPPPAPLPPATPIVAPEADAITPLPPEAVIEGVPGGVIGGVGGGISGGVLGGVRGGIAIAPSTPVAGVAPLEVFGQAVAPRPALAPQVVWAGEGTQDNKNKTPVMPENELLNVLTDIVKRDADPQVRNEALQGIYRLRSDAAINSLIQLYDGTSDVKVKSEIIGYLLRRDGDNSRAIAKLVAIAKSEQNEELRNRAVRYLGSVKGDEGANHLISIYDGLQDQKTKQYVIRSLAANKSRKALDKLIQIAKNDTDPAVRQSAIRALYGIDNRLYFELIDRPGARVGMLGPDFKFESPRSLEFEGNGFRFDTQKWEEMQKDWQEKHRELLDKLRIEGLDKLKIEDLHNRLRRELPQIELRLKDLERMRFDFDLKQLDELEGQLRLRRSLVENQLAYLQAQQANSPQVIAARNLLGSLDQDLARLTTLRGRAVRPAPARRVQVTMPRAASTL